MLGRTQYFMGLTQEHNTLPLVGIDGLIIIGPKREKMYLWTFLVIEIQCHFESEMGYITFKSKEIHYHSNAFSS